ncbi:uncharacterized protein BDW43DRAFT_254890 [Aspergillus alliaceus]|uniref:uncharacterized protein n=1 Tax=Petromyces alliaceus TaxID=209559 RepID=UPI0012A66473|nr:uncharacterized protein BDW43DRAFT_254890 [Aspergillus alliaceus]KAB8227346.1 hypothetical protein BDW43DRAFT_254890 [Aspergillus alliaceus]
MPPPRSNRSFCYESKTSREILTGQENNPDVRGPGSIPMEEKRREYYSYRGNVPQTLTEKQTASPSSSSVMDKLLWGSRSPTWSDFHSRPANSTPCPSRAEELSTQQGTRTPRSRPSNDLPSLFESQVSKATRDRSMPSPASQASGQQDPYSQQRCLDHHGRLSGSMNRDLSHPPGSQSRKARSERRMPSSASQRSGQQTTITQQFPQIQKRVAEPYPGSPYAAGNGKQRSDDPVIADLYASRDVCSADTDQESVDLLPQRSSAWRRRPPQQDNQTTTSQEKLRPQPSRVHDSPRRQAIRAPGGRSSVPNHPEEAIASHRSPPTLLDLEQDGLEFSTAPSLSHLRDDATSIVTLSSDWGDEDENEDDMKLDLETEYLRQGQREKARIQWLVQRVVVRDTESHMVARQLKRKATRQWTEPEYERLVELFAIFGPRWESILEADQKHPRGPQIHPSRTGVNLKDKMRNHKIKLLRDGREIPLRLHCIQLTRNHMRQIAKHRAHAQLTQRLPLQNRWDGANARLSPPPSRAPTKEQPPTFKWPREIL